MEYFQQHYSKRHEAFAGLTGLETVDLPNKGLLAGIDLMIEAKQGATEEKPDAWLYDMIRKVEVIVDGSTVVKSLEGVQLMAMQHYWYIPEVYPVWFNTPNATVRMFVHICMGRWYHDKEYMLDLGKVNDPELRITYDWTATAHYGWTAVQALATDPAPMYNCIPHLLRESDAMPKGYIRTAEAYRYPSGASREENMILPRKHVYCGLYLQSWYHDEGLRHNADYIELNLNNGEKLPYRKYWRDLCADISRIRDPYQFTGVVNPADGADYPIQTEEGIIVCTPQSPITLGILNSYTDDDGYFFKLRDSDGTVWSGGTSQEVVTKCKGILPFSVWACPALDLKNPATWIDSDLLGDFWLRVQADTNAGTHAIVKLISETVIPQP